MCWTGRFAWVSGEPTFNCLKMILYAILFFIALCIGMAVSVYAFGTGGKRKKVFQDIYFSIENVDGIGVVYTKNGEFSAILKMENPMQNVHFPTQNLEKILLSTLWGVVAPLISVRLKSTWRRSRLTISALCPEIMPSITFVMFIAACDNAS